MQNKITWDCRNETSVLRYLKESFSSVHPFQQLIQLTSKLFNALVSSRHYTVISHFCQLTDDIAKSRQYRLLLVQFTNRRLKYIITQLHIL